MTILRRLDLRLGETVRAGATMPETCGGRGRGGGKIGGRGCSCVRLFPQDTAAERNGFSIGSIIFPAENPTTSQVTTRRNRHSYPATFSQLTMGRHQRLSLLRTLPMARCRLLCRFSRARQRAVAKADVECFLLAGAVSVPVALRFPHHRHVLPARPSLHLALVAEAWPRFGFAEVAAASALRTLSATQAQETVLRTA